MVRLTERPGEHKSLAITLILLATLVFAISDAMAKLMTAGLPPAEILWIRGVVVAIITLPIAFARIGRRAFVTDHPKTQIFRGVCVFTSSLCFVTGLSSLPLADAAAINFIWPILITLLAIPILGEKVGVRRWAAMIFGFMGMLLIIRPGSGAFQTSAIFPLGAAVLWALGSVVTRRMSATEPPETTLVWSALVALVGSSLLLPFIWVTPSWYEIGLGVLVGLGSAVGHAMIVFAYERANATMLAPFAYLQLVWSMLLGLFLFQTVPDRWILIGAGMIVLSGLYTAHRERVRGAVR